MTEIQKKIYNLYLSTVRSENNKPFRYRKDFSNFEENPNYFFIQKLDGVFKQYPHLLKKEFFEAPFRIYPEKDKHFDLKFYASAKGLSTCITYLNLIDKMNPQEQLLFIKDSLRFIFDFCKEKKIRLCEYAFYKSIAQPDCLKHLKQHNISWYVIFDIPSLLAQIAEMPRDEFELYFGENKEYGDYLVKLNQFPEIRILIQKGIKILNKHLDSEVKKM